MRKFVLLLAILALPGLAFGQPPVVYMSAEVAGSNTVDMQAPGPIVIDVFINVTNAAGGPDGWQYNLSVDGGANDHVLTTDPNPDIVWGIFQPGLFMVTPAEYIGVGQNKNIWDLTNTTLAGCNAVGAEVWQMAAGSLPVGKFLLGQYGMSFNGPVGTYVIDLNSNNYGWGSGVVTYNSGANNTTMVPPGDGSDLLTITPEPASILLLLGALPFLRRRRH